MKKEHGFSSIDYMKNLKKVNFTQEQAETLAKGTEGLIERIDNLTDHIDKNINRIDKEIVQSSNRIILWVAGLLIASGIIQHLLK